jgi:hypothetical protein
MNYQIPKPPKSDGALFVNNNKQKENHPDWRGHVMVTTDQINELIRMQQMGLEPQLQVGAWDRTAQQTGNRYMFLSTEVYIKEQVQPQQQQGYPQQPQSAYQPPPAPMQQQPAPPPPQQGYQQQPPPQQQQGYQQPPAQAPAPQQPMQPMQPQQPAANPGFDDDDIPFN